MRVEAVIFDLDGTLVDSRQAFLHQNLDLLKEFGKKDARMEEAISLLGQSPSQILSTFGIPKSEHEKYVAKIDMSYINYYMKKYAKPFSGVSQCLKKLRDKGIRIGVATNTTREILEETLKWVKIKDLVNVAVCADGTVKEKPEPDMLLQVIEKLNVSSDKVIYVGDTELDVLAAKKAGLSCFITVSSGIGRLENIINLRPDVLIPGASWVCRVISARCGNEKYLSHLNIR